MIAPLLTTSDVAKVLRVERKLVYELVSDGRLECVRFGRALRFTSAQVEAFIAKASGAQSDSRPTVVRLQRPRRTHDR